jgi:hypothetical protein
MFISSNLVYLGSPLHRIFLQSKIIYYSFWELNIFILVAYTVLSSNVEIITILIMHSNKLYCTLIMKKNTLNNLILETRTAYIFHIQQSLVISPTCANIMQILFSIEPRRKCLCMNLYIPIIYEIEIKWAVLLQEDSSFLWTWTGEECVSLWYAIICSIELGQKFYGEPLTVLVISYE